MTTTTETPEALQEQKEHFEAIIQDWLSHDDTPSWAHGLVRAGADPEATVYHLLHVQTDISLCEMIMENNNRADLEAWSKSEQVPDWFREALVQFTFAETKWAQNRILADLDTVKTVVEGRIGFTP